MSVFAQTGYDVRLEWGVDDVVTSSREPADPGAHVPTACLRDAHAVSTVVPRPVEGCCRDG